MPRLMMLSACILACAAPMSRDDDVDKPSDKVPQLKALAHCVGTWDVEFTSKDLPFARAKTTAKWVLDGRFVEQDNEVYDMNGAVALRVKTLFAFDASKNAYRSWTFVSDGWSGESDGVWDEKTRVMTFIARKKEGEGFTTTTSDFSEEGVSSWKIAITDADGKLAAEITGKNRRAKAPKPSKK